MKIVNMGVEAGILWTQQLMDPLHKELIHGSLALSCGAGHMNGFHLSNSHISSLTAH
jgi:hypothetical protein